MHLCYSNLLLQSSRPFHTTKGLHYYNYLLALKLRKKCNNCHNKVCCPCFKVWFISALSKVETSILRVLKLFWSSHLLWQKVISGSINCSALYNSLLFISICLQLIKLCCVAYFSTKATSVFTDVVLRLFKIFWNELPRCNVMFKTWVKCGQITSDKLRSIWKAISKRLLSMVPMQMISGNRSGLCFSARL